MVFQVEVYYKVDRLLTGLTTQPTTTARWYSNKTSLNDFCSEISYVLVMSFQIKDYPVRNLAVVVRF